MVQSDSSTLFIHNLEERHRHLLSTMDNCLSTLFGEDPAAKLNACKVALAAATRLSELLATIDRPSWLNSVIKNLQTFEMMPKNDNKQSLNMLVALMQNYQAMGKEEWSFGNRSDVGAYDFDKIYEEFKDNSRLPNLFDEIISILEKMIRSGDIDSIKLTKALEGLIATLHKNKSGSYFSMRSAWDFTLSLMKNYLWEQLSDIPALGSLVRALRKTMEDTNSEMKGLHAQIREAMQEKFKGDFPFLSYEQNKALPESQAAHTADKIEQN